MNILLNKYVIINEKKDLSSEFFGLWQLIKAFILSASFAQKKNNQIGKLFKSIIDSLENSVQFGIVVHVTITGELFMNELIVHKNVENTGVVHVCFARNGDFIVAELVQNLRLNKLKFWTVISNAAVNDVDFHARQSSGYSPHFFLNFYLVKKWNEMKRL